VSTVEKDVTSHVCSKVLFKDGTQRGDFFVNLNTAKQTKHNERITAVPKNNFLRRRDTKISVFF